MSFRSWQELMGFIQNAGEEPLSVEMINNLLEELKEGEDDEKTLFMYGITKEFERWMKEEAGISGETVNRYINAFWEGYDAAYERLDELDLYELLWEDIVDMPNITGSDIVKGDVLDSVDTYRETIDELLAEGVKLPAHTMFAFNKFKEFIDWKTDDNRRLFSKKAEIPYVEEFEEWLEEQLGKSYDSIRKEISSLRRVNVWLMAMTNHEPYDLLVRLAGLKSHENRLRVIGWLRDAKKEMSPEEVEKLQVDLKTISNALSNVEDYIRFLKDRDKKMSKLLEEEISKSCEENDCGNLDCPITFAQLLDML